MALLTAVRTALESPSEQHDRAARCRNCGRYYCAVEGTCPHCGSANRLLGGPPDCDHDRA